MTSLLLVLGPVASECAVWDITEVSGLVPLDRDAMSGWVPLDREMSGWVWPCDFEGIRLFGNDSDSRNLINSWDRDDSAWKTNTVTTLQCAKHISD